MYKAYNGSTVYNCDDEEEIKKLFIGHKVKVIKMMEMRQYCN